VRVGGAGGSLPGPLSSQFLAPNKESNVDNSKKWPCSEEVQDQCGTLTEASHNDFLAWDYKVEEGSNVLTHPYGIVFVFLFKGKWRVAGTNGL
jgi:hypothetical protein